MTKFKIQDLSIKNGSSNGKPWTMFNFKNTNDNQFYSCFAQKGYTDSFKDGYEFEAEFTEKPNPKNPSRPYKNIQWPKVLRGTPAPYTPANNQLIEAIKIQMDRLESKVDRLLGATVAVMPFETPLEMPPDYYEKHGLPTDIPPLPEEDSTPF